MFTTLEGFFITFWVNFTNLGKKYNYEQKLCQLTEASAYRRHFFVIVEA